MQKEIQELVVALYHEQKKEAEVLQSILASIAVGGAARRNMIRDIANAVALTETSKTQTAPTQTATSKPAASELGTQPQGWYESDVARAINTIRTRTA